MENDSDENSGSCNLPANKTIELSIGRRKDRDFDTGDSNGDESKKGNQRGLGVVEPSSPRLCSPYTDDIFKFYHLIEDDEKWKPNMENIQKSIDVQTRVTEINQLIEKVGSLGYDIRTLCLAVSLMDRVLSAKSVSMDKIQLLLLACLLIAAKYQGFTPHSEDFITALHNAEKVVTMEEEVLDCLQFDVWTPTAMAFVGKYITAAQMHDESVLRCYQLIKLTLLDHICIKFKPSIVAASVVYVAKILMNPTKHPWDSHMQSNSGIHLANLKECVERIQWLCNHKDSDADKVEFLVSIPMKFFEFDSGDQ